MHELIGEHIIYNAYYGIVLNLPHPVKLRSSDHTGEDHNHRVSISIAPLVFNAIAHGSQNRVDFLAS